MSETTWRLRCMHACPFVQLLVRRCPITVWAAPVIYQPCTLLIFTDNNHKNCNYKYVIGSSTEYNLQLILTLSGPTQVSQNLGGWHCKGRHETICLLFGRCRSFAGYKLVILRDLSTVTRQQMTGSTSSTNFLFAYYIFTGRYS